MYSVSIFKLNLQGYPRGTWSTNSDRAQLNETNEFKITQQKRLRAGFGQRRKEEREKCKTLVIVFQPLTNKNIAISFRRDFVRLKCFSLKRFLIFLTVFILVLALLQVEHDNYKIETIRKNQMLSISVFDICSGSQLYLLYINIKYRTGAK